MQHPRSLPSKEDASDLKTLATATLVYAGLVALFSVCVFLYISFVAVSCHDPSNPKSAYGVGVCILVGFVIASVFFAKAVVLLFSAIGLRTHRWRWISYFGAVLMMLNAPIGTVIAVFTFIVLGRSSVDALYQRRPVMPWTPPPVAPKPRAERAITPVMLARVSPPRYRVATPT
jgi:hypothetical protein